MAIDTDTATATATDTETVEINLGEVKIVESGPAARLITIEIPADEVNSKLETSFGILHKNAVLPGFRPGKTPRRLLEKRFGADLRKEAQAELLRDSYTKVVDENKLRVLGEPIIQNEDDLELVSGKPFVYSIELEIIPEFEIPNLEGVEITKPVIEITPELVEQEINDQLKRFGSVEEITGEPEPGDYLIGATELINVESESEDKEVLGHIPEALTRLPEKAAETKSGVIGGIQVDDLDKLLKNKKIGDLITVETTGPEQHEIEAVRGKKIRIEYKILSIKRLTPASIDELTKQLGLEDEATLRERVTQAIEFRIVNEQKDIMRRQLVRYLIDNIEVELPVKASANQAQRNLLNARLRMLDEGASTYEIEQRLAELRGKSDEAAQHDLKIMFIMERLADKFEIQVDEREVTMRLIRMARQQGMTPEQLKEQLNKTGEARLLVMQVKHEKAADYAVEQFTSIIEKSAEEWNKEQQQRDTNTEGSKTVAVTDKDKDKAKTKDAGSAAATTTRKKTSKKKKKTTTKKTTKKTDDQS